MKTRSCFALGMAALLALVAPGVPAMAQSAPPSIGAGISASAPNDAAPVPWSSLSADQRRLLSGFSRSWGSLPAQRQHALATGSSRWLSMTPAQRVAARQRFKRWQALPPGERQLLRRRWEQFRSLPPDRQRAVRENFRKFQSLPLQRQQALRRRWQAATPAERQQMLQQARQRAFARQQMRQRMRRQQGLPEPLRPAPLHAPQMRRRAFPRRGSFGGPRARPQIFRAAPFRPFRPGGSARAGYRGRFR